MAYKIINNLNEVKDLIKDKFIKNLLFDVKEYKEESEKFYNFLKNVENKKSYNLNNDEYISKIEKINVLYKSYWILNYSNILKVLMKDYFIIMIVLTKWLLLWYAYFKKEKKLVMFLVDPANIYLADKPKTDVIYNSSSYDLYVDNNKLYILMFNYYNKDKLVEVLDLDELKKYKNE